MGEGQSRYDQAILAQVPSMCDLLRVKKFTPKKLAWEDSLYSGRGRRIPLPVDYVLVGRQRMILAKRLQGILTPEEWRPLIGSILLVKSWERPRANKSLLVGILAAMAYYVPVLLLVFDTTILGSAGIILVNPLFPLLVALFAQVIFGRVYSPGAHREALRADLQVAGLVGRGLFLDVLQKIDRMGFKDAEKLNRKSRMFKQPSLQERIRNLQSGATIPPVS